MRGGEKLSRFLILPSRHGRVNRKRPQSRRNRTVPGQASGAACLGERSCVSDPCLGFSASDLRAGCFRHSPAPGRSGALRESVTEWRVMPIHSEALHSQGFAPTPVPPVCPSGPRIGPRPPRLASHPEPGQPLFCKANHIAGGNQAARATPSHQVRDNRLTASGRNSTPRPRLGCAGEPAVLGLTPRRSPRPDGFRLSVSWDRVFCRGLSRVAGGARTLAGWPRPANRIDSDEAED